MSGDSNLDKLSEAARRALENIIRGDSDQPHREPNGSSGEKINRLHMLKFQLEQAEANLQGCAQLGQDPNTFMSLRIALGHVENFIGKLGDELGLAEIPRFAQKQFSTDDLAELKVNLRQWHDRVVAALKGVQ